MSGTLTVQFVTDTRLMIPGTASVGVRGQLLEIGRGKTGAIFPYRSPRDQIEHYGEQKYVLMSAVDEEGLDVDHEDIEVNLSKGPTTIDAEDVSSGPEGVHEVMKDRGAIESKGSAPSFQEDSAPKDSVPKRITKKVIKRNEKKKVSKKRKSKKE